MLFGALENLAGGPSLGPSFLWAVFLLRVPHSFAFCAKGWEARSPLSTRRTRRVGSVFPPLPGTQGWGTPGCGDSKTDVPPADLAFQWLERSVDTGFACWPFFRRDPCLKNLRSDARFELLVSSLQAKYPDHLGLL